MTLNLNDKIWNDHGIHEMDGGKSLLFADRHFADEATSPLAFEPLRSRAVEVPDPALSLAEADQIIFCPGNGQRFAFIVPGHAKERLVSVENGMPVVLKCEEEIRTFADQRFRTSPWARSDRPTNN